MSLSPNKYLSLAEQTALIDTLDRLSLKKPRNTTMLLFMLQTGARPSEVISVRWSDIDFFEKKVFIKTLKGGKDRWIPLGDKLFTWLLHWKRSCKSELIFPIGYWRFYDIWNDYRPVKKKLHSLRHTFAFNLYKKSLDVRMVQKALGHKQISTTAVYLDIEQDIDELRKFVCGEELGIHKTLPYIDSVLTI